MSWDSVVAGIQFWSSPADTWGQDPRVVRANSGVAFSPEQQSQILGYLQQLYDGSAEARSLLEAGTTGAVIRLFQMPSNNPGVALRFTGIAGFNLSAIDQFYYFEKNGRFVKEFPQLTIIHELFHAIYGIPDLTGTGFGNDVTNSDLNSPTFDHDGPTLREQNIVAEQMGWASDHTQVSYLSGIMNTDSRYALLRSDISYSEGNQVDIVRFGDQPPFSFQDILDLSQRTDGSRDLVFGFTGDDTILTGAGNDYLYGGPGNDTLFGGSGNNFIDGGDRLTPIADDGIDTVDYTKGDQGQPPPHGIVINIDASTVNDTIDGYKPIIVSDNGYGGTDRLLSIEKIIATSSTDRVTNSGNLDGYGLTGGMLEVDGGGGTDTLDFSGRTGGVFLGGAQNGPEPGLFEVFKNRGLTDGTGLFFKGFEDLILSASSDVVILHAADAPDVKVIETGAGNDIVSTDIPKATIDFGNGNDTLLFAGPGSVVNARSGQDTFYLSDKVLIAGATPTDKILTASGRQIHGALGSMNTESPWVGQGDGLWYALDVAGELVIRNAAGQEMFVGGYQGGPGVPLSQQTAGILIGRLQIWASRLLDLTRPYNSYIDSIFKAGNDVWFTKTGQANLFNADPLVLDLNGDGLNLTGMSSIAPIQ